MIQAPSRQLEIPRSAKICTRCFKPIARNPRRYAPRWRRPSALLNSGGIQIGTSGIVIGASGIVVTDGTETNAGTCCCTTTAGAGCAQCSGSTPLTFTFVLEDIAECLDVPGDAAYALSPTNGTYLLTQYTGGGSNCVFRYTGTGTFGNSYASGSGCTGDTDDPYVNIFIELELAPKFLTVNVDNGHTTIIVFQGNYTASAPYDCFATRSFADITTGFGGTGTISA